MATRTPSRRLHTPGGIASYVYLFTPRQRTDAKGNAKGDPKYSLSLLFPEGTDLSALEDAARAAGEERFGDKFMTLVEKGKVNWPFQDTADMDEPEAPFDQPGTVIGFKSADKPGIVDADAMPIMDKSDIYSGMIARVSCRPFAYDNESKGVGFYLVNVQKLEDGTRLSGNPTAEADFGAPSGEARGKNRTTTRTSSGTRPAQNIPRTPARPAARKPSGYDDLV